MKEKWYFADIQLFADEGAQGGSAETGDESADAEQNNAEVTAEEEFGNLISGKFKEQFTRKTQEIIDRRFKETKSLEEYKERVSPLVESLMKKYGIQEGEEHLILEELGENQSSQVNAENNESGEVAEKGRLLKNRMGGWLRESKELAEVYPDFDLRKELKGNPLFARLIIGGAPLRAAFETVHNKELLSGAMAYAADKARRQVVKGIEAKGLRPLENGISSQSAVLTSVDVNSLTSKDILKILKQVENGANISF